MPLPRQRVCPADWPSTNGATSQPLSFRPVAGRAIVFWHETVDGSEALADVFHYGCPVIHGTKRTIVKFKSYAPSDARCAASPYCRLR